MKAGEPLYWYQGIRHRGHYGWGGAVDGPHGRTVDGLIERGVLKVLPAEMGKFRSPVVLAGAIDPRQVKALVKLLDEAAEILKTNKLRLFSHSGTLVIYHRDRPYQELGEAAIVATVDSMMDLTDGGDAP